MAMIAADLSTAIQAEIAGIAESGRSHSAVWDAVAAAIIAYIQAHAVVTITGTATGVTAGAAAAPVTGTGSVS